MMSEVDFGILYHGHHILDEHVCIGILSPEDFVDNGEDVERFMDNASVVCEFHVDLIRQIDEEVSRRVLPDELDQEETHEDVFRDLSSN
jgi:hypothetical protein